jgi:anthranilate phosphoribosyltransferase
MTNNRSLKMKEYITKLLDKKAFSQQENYALFQQLSSAPIEQQAAILALMQAQIQLPEALLGARQYLLEHTRPVSCDFDIVDIVGTGGDNSKSFNISTAASLVMASCGVYVAKHGGRSVTSQSGSADVLDLLNIPTPSLNSDIVNNLKKNNYVYLSASLFNPLFNHFKSLRKNLGITSIFNLLAPLMNPLHPKRAVIGVYQKNLIAPVISVLQQIGFTHALVVHAQDGLDEFSISAPTDVAELKNDHIRYYTLTPESLGFKKADSHAVLGGTPQENANLITAILNGILPGPKTDIVLFNAAAGLLVAGKAHDYASGVKMAKEAILSGKTAKLLTQLQPFLNRIKPNVLARINKIQPQAIVQKNKIDFCSIFSSAPPGAKHPIIISEIKFASPSSGKIYPGKLNPIEIANSYIKNNASAVSVLTEPDFFKGDMSYIKDIRTHFPTLPILCKDFILSKKQIDEALLYGANAILLIIAFLEPEQLDILYHYAISLNLTPIIEVHDQEELEQALMLDPMVIGINNRDLNTLEINLNTSKNLIKHIPKHIFTLSESGIKTQKDIKEMHNLGFNGLLIGTELMRFSNPGLALHQLLQGDFTDAC